MSEKYQQLYDCFPQELLGDGRQHAAATARNRDFILEILKTDLPQSGHILEIASGTGEHGLYMVPKMQQSNKPRLWQPTDPSEDKLASIKGWQKQQKSNHLLHPLFLDTTDDKWGVEEDEYPHKFSSILCINMIHIAPWEACLGLLAGAGRILPKGGCLYLYGPYKVDGEHTAPSNAQFDKTLRARNSSFGIRDVNDVTMAAEKQGLSFKNKHQMPANNLSLIFEKL